jgi:mono/diheme cytochrome c family protein
MRKTPHIYGLLAEFEGPEQLLAATRAAHRAGYRRMDAYTPFPVHGLAQALGLRQTRLPWIVLAGGIIGCLGGFGMQYFAYVIHYPLNIGGRPLNSWPSWIIITFEMTILCAAFSAVFGMLALNGLPRPYHPLFYVPSFELASRTHFFLCIEAADAKFDLHDTQVFLRSLRPSDIAIVPASKLKEERSPADAAVAFVPETMPGRATSPAIGGHGEGHQEPGDRPARPAEHVGGTTTTGSTNLSSLLLGLLLPAVAVLGLGGCDDANVDLQGNLEDNARITAMEPTPFFADGTSARPIVDGTVARGDARLDEHLYLGRVNGQEATEFPFPINQRVLDRGREQFEVFCSMCHNSDGSGNGMIVKRGFTPPPSFHIDRLRNAPPGHFFDVMTNGWGAMYSYNDRVKVEDRWAIAAYIRVLQQSQYADANQLPPEDQEKLRLATTQPDKRWPAEPSRAHGQPSHGPTSETEAQHAQPQATQPEVTR